MGMKPRKNPRRSYVTGNVAVLSALNAGVGTVKEIAAGTKMTPIAVLSSMSSLRKKDMAKRTNSSAAGIGVIAKYKITPKGRQELRRAKKAMGN